MTNILFFRAAQSLAFYHTPQLVPRLSACYHVCRIILPHNMAASASVEASSASRPDVAAVSHVSLDLKIDFSASALVGTGAYTITRSTPSVSELILDTNHLIIHGVTAGGADIAWELKEYVEPFGRALHITLPPAGEDGKVIVSVKYETTPECAALQWLQPEQTAGKKHPYLFTQCQAIHARSLLPCQDSPKVKMTYDAVITTPKPLRAVMSALPHGEPVEEGDSLKFSFKQPVPMPSYLVALGVGNLSAVEIGPRTTVYAEPEVVADAAWEFADTEQFIVAAEKIVGPYVWGRYDLLMLPPSFPYGGMENPCLTFVTPTLIAKDRSLVDVVAHEIAHSWTGNLVSPTTWNHFWLNEGWTMMLQRLIIASMKVRVWADSAHCTLYHIPTHPHTHTFHDACAHSCCLAAGRGEPGV